MSARYSPVASLFPLLLAGVLAGLTYWLEFASQQREVVSSGKLRHDPDYMIDHFELRRFDKQGKLQHTLRAEGMIHYPDDDSTIVRKPFLIYHREPPTFVSAREAYVDGDGEHVQLVGDVRVTRANLRNKPPTQLTTEHLDAYPDKEIASSSSPVTITQGDSKVSGSALAANNNTSIYVLEGPVRGIFYRNVGISPSSQPVRAAATSIPHTMAVPQPKPRTPAPSKPRPKAKPTTKTPVKN